MTNMADKQLVLLQYKEFFMNQYFKDVDRQITQRIMYSFFFLKDFIYLFLERGERKEKEKERNINVWLPLAYPPPGTWPETQACALTGNQTGNPLVHSLYSIH